MDEQTAPDPSKLVRATTQRGLLARQLEAGAPRTHRPNSNANEPPPASEKPQSLVSAAVTGWVPC